MKKLTLFTLISLCAFSLFAEKSQLSSKPLNMPGTAKRYFHFAIFNADWKGTELTSKTLISDKGYPKMDKSGGFVNQGTYKLAKGEARFTQTLSIITPTRGKYRFELKFAEKTKIDGSWLKMLVGNEEWAKKGFLIDGKYVEKIHGKNSPYMKNVKELAMPNIPDGKYILRGNFDVQLVDISKTPYGVNSLTLRVMSIPSRGLLDKLVYEFDVEYVADSAKPLDLSSAMNMGFKDDKDGDGKGGWTDQGATNDLRCMIPGTRKFDKVDMTIVDPLANKGKSCIALRGNQRKYFPESAQVSWKEPVKGCWLYLLNSTAWDAPMGTKVGDVICKFADGKTQTIEMQSKVHTANFWMPQPLPQASIAWRGDNDVASLGLHLTRIPLQNKSGLIGLTFKSAGTSVWMVVAASVSENKIETAEKIRIVMQASNEWIPVKENVRKIKPGSALDFSAHLDAPAGKYGEIMNQDGKLVFKNNKKPIRFYGANICFTTNYLTHKKDIDEMADNFARIGYNIVRFHHFDRDIIDYRSKKFTTPKADLMDRFDYTLAAFKKRGIYVTMDLFISRNITKDTLKNYPKGLDRSSYKGMVWIDPDAQANFLQFAKELLTHKNPYTGLMWKDDPAIINLDLVNEDAISWTTLTKYAKPIYEKEFNQYMQQKGLKSDFYSFSRYWSMFLADTYPQLYAKVKSQLRDMGVDKMLCSQNHNQNMLTLLTRQHYDIIENHTYWCHPAFLVQAWGGPALVQNISSMSKLCGSLNGLFKSRFFGKPYSITEWDYVNPNRYAVEGAFLFGAYSALQDWNALCRFSYSGTEKSLLDPKTELGYFNIANDPIRILSERAGVVFFTRGDVQASDITVPVVLNNRHFDNESNPGDLGPATERIGLIAKTGYVTFNPDEKTALPKGSKAVIYADKIGKRLYADMPEISENDHLDGIQKLIREKVLPKGSEDYKNRIYRSTTKQIELRANELSFIVTTPRSEGFLVDEGKKVSGKFAEVKNLKNFCGVLVAAIDKGTLKDSKRILILHLTDAKETGMVFNDANMSIIEKHGTTPYLIRNGKISVKLNRSLKGFKLYALHFDGSRFKEIPMKFKDSSTEFELQNNVGGTPCAAYELVK